MAAQTPADSEDPLINVALRARLAIATRCARRVFPILVDAEGLRKDILTYCDEGIAAAE